MPDTRYREGAMTNVLVKKLNETPHCLNCWRRRPCSGRERYPRFLRTYRTIPNVIVALVAANMLNLCTRSSLRVHSQAGWPSASLQLRVAGQGRLPELYSCIAIVKVFGCSFIYAAIQYQAAVRDVCQLIRPECSIGPQHHATGTLCCPLRLEFADGSSFDSTRREIDSFDGTVAQNDVKVRGLL